MTKAYKQLKAHQAQALKDLDALADKWKGLTGECSFWHVRFSWLADDIRRRNVGEHTNGGVLPEDNVWYAQTLEVSLVESAQESFGVVGDLVRYSKSRLETCRRESPKENNIVDAVIHFSKVLSDIKVGDKLHFLIEKVGGKGFRLEGTE